jgi:PAS domain S-box-containing protein
MADKASPGTADPTVAYPEEQTFPQLLEALDEILFTLDADGIILDISEPIYKIIGYTTGELIGRPFARFVHPHHREVAMSRFSGGIPGGPLPLELKLKRKNGRYIWVRCFGLQLRENNTMTGMRGILTDISAHQRVVGINRALFNIISAISSTASLAELYQRIYEALAPIIDLRNFCIAEYDAQKDLVTFPFFRDEKDDNFDPIPNASGTRYLTSEVIVTGAPLIAKQSEIEQRFPDQADDPSITQCQVWLGVPLMTGDKVSGVMAVQSYSDPHCYDRTDIDVMMAVAGQTAIAIERKRDEEELERRVQERTERIEEANRRLRQEITERRSLRDRLVRSERMAVTGQLAASIAHEINSPLQGISALLQVIGKKHAGDDETLKNIDLLKGAFSRIREFAGSSGGGGRSISGFW